MQAGRPLKPFPAFTGRGTYSLGQVPGQLLPRGFLRFQRETGEKLVVSPGQSPRLAKFSFRPGPMVELTLTRSR